MLPENAFSIAPYQSSLQNEVIELILSVQQEFGINVTLDDQPDLRNIEHAYQNNAGNFWVAQREGKVIGTIALIDACDGIGCLRKMFVRPDYRGAASGVGQCLLDILLKWAEEHGLQHIYLGTTEKFQAAQRFYRKNGFVVCADEALPENVMRIRMKVDTIHFRKDLR